MCLYLFLIEMIDDINATFSLLELNFSCRFRSMKKLLHCGCILIELVLIQPFFNKFNTFSFSACFHLKFKHKQSVMIRLLFGLNLLQKLFLLINNLKFYCNLLRQICNKIHVPLVLKEVIDHHLLRTLMSDQHTLMNCQFILSRHFISYHLKTFN